VTEQKQTTQNRLRSQIYYQLHGEFYSLETANQEVDRLSATIAAEIDTLTRERDKARAEVEKWRKELTLCNKERFDAQTQLAEARAEVERLRPAAEAWEARERYLNYEQYGATAEYRDAALRECHRKDVIARAAKERKP